MRFVRATIAALVFSTLLAGSTHAAGTKHWSSRTLHLGLAYPDAWRVVAEHGAALKLLSPDAAGEFEIIPLTAPLSPAGLAAQADSALARLHCGTAVTHASGTVGRLGVGGKVARGACTGGDLGWQLSVTAFDFGQRGLLLRSWLFHQQPRDGAALAAIASSLAANP